MAGCGVGAFHRADWVWWTMAMRIKEARGKESKVVLKLPELDYWREAEEGDGLIFLKNTVGEIPHCRTIYIEKKR